MQIEEKRFHAMKKAIALAAEQVEDISFILMELSKVSDDEWEGMIARSKRHRFEMIKSTCLICSLPYEEWGCAFFGYVCPDCRKLYAHEIQQITGQRCNARLGGLPATLTLAEWVNTKKYFRDLCAYCQQYQGTILEHFIPWEGTTCNNCVPACHTCNTKKRNKHPDEVTLIPRADIERVRAYLLQFSDATEIAS